VEFSILSPGGTVSVPVRGRETVAAGSFEIGPDGSYKATQYAGGRFRIETAGGQRVEFYVEPDVPRTFRVRPDGRSTQLPLQGVEFALVDATGRYPVDTTPIYDGSRLTLRPNGTCEASADAAGRRYTIETAGGQKMELVVETGTRPPPLPPRPPQPPRQRRG
jgi:hypothetical protein